MATLDSCDIWIPTLLVKTGLVYSCPGREERDAGRPCAGKTGINLEEGLGYLTELEPQIFHSRDRYDYFIANAWPQVEFEDKLGRYEGATGRSEAKLSEVQAPENIQRLFDQIAHLEYVVACGRRAQRAVKRCVERLGLGARVAYVRHTGDRGLVSGKAGTTLAAEIETWACEVRDQLSHE